MREKVLLLAADRVRHIEYLYIDPVSHQKQKGSLEVTIIRSKRKTIGIHIDEEGQVSLRIPMRASEQRAMDFAREKLDWVLTKVAQQKRRAKERQEIESNSSLSPEQHEALKKRYIKAAKEYFPKRAEYYADLIGVEYDRIRIAEQKTRWGSCSSNKTLSFNWKLMLAPPRVLDYVVVHELCHLIEMNHSKRFWQLVESVLPEYREYREWLKKNGHTLRLG